MLAGKKKGGGGSVSQNASSDVQNSMYVGAGTLRCGLGGRGPVGATQSRKVNPAPAPVFQARPAPLCLAPKELPRPLCLGAKEI